MAFVTSSLFPNCPDLAPDNAGASSFVSFPPMAKTTGDDEVDSDP
jgi:hypothetical protein